MAWSGLRLTLAAAIVAAAAAAPFDAVLGVYNATGHAVGGDWHAPGKAGLTLRLSRSDGGVMGGCGTIPNAGAFTLSPSSGVTIGTAANKRSYVEFPLTLAAAATSARYTAALAANAVVCGSDASNALAATTFLRVGFTLTEFKVMVGSTSIAAPLTADGILQADAEMIPTNTVGSVSIVLKYSGTPALFDYTSSLSSVAYTNVFDWPAGVPTPDAPAYDSTANTLTYTISNFSALSSTYDIGIKAGVIKDANSDSTLQLFVAPQRIRFLYGMPALFMNTATQQQFFTRTQNSTHAEYVVGGTNLTLTQVRGGGASQAFVDLDTFYTALTRVGGTFDFSSSIFDQVTFRAQAVSSMRANNYTLPIGSLTEGTYVFTRNSSVSLTDTASNAEPAKRNLVVTIDRTAPVAAAARWTGTRQVIGSAGNVQLPTTLFTDAVSPASGITVLSVTALGDNGGYTATVPAPLSSAFLIAPTVLGAPADLVFSVVARDEAGNIARALFTVPTNAAVTPALTAADYRQVYTASTLRTGGPASMTSNAMVVTAVATFADAIDGITAADVTVTGGTSTVSLVSATGGNRVFTFAITFSAFTTDTTATVVMPAAAGTRSSDGASTAVSNTVTVLFDTSAPTVAAFRADDATLNVPYFSYIPLSVLTSDTSGGSNNNGGTSAALIAVTAATTTDTTGLTVALGKLGRAYVYGTSTSLPSSKTCGGNSADVYVSFTLTLQDEAGNTNTTSLCIKVATAVSTTFSLSRSNIAFTEGGSAANLDASASLASSVSMHKVTIFLESPDDDGSNAELLVGTAPSASYAVSTYTQPNADYVGTIVLTGVSGTDTITPAVATTFLQGVTYGNAKTLLTPGFRTIRVVAQKYVSASQFQVIGYASRAVFVSIVNAAPVVTGITATVTYTEGTDTLAGVALAADAVTITDADDTTVTLATLAIATTESSSNYGACDTARDVLVLPIDYTASPRVTGSWSPSICTLVLRPIAGSTVTLAEMATALGGVRYRNNNATDPANKETTAYKLKRSISVTVTDAASAGQAGAPATSTAATSVVTIATQDDQPIINNAAWYGANGIAQSTDASAAVYQLTIGGTQYAVRAFPIAYNVSGSGTATGTVSVDLSKMSSGVFGRGAILDTDSADPPTGSAITLTLVDPVTLAVPGSAPGVTVPANMGAAGTSYSVSNASTITVTVTQDSATRPGFLAIEVSYGPTAASKGYLLLAVRRTRCQATYASFNPDLDVNDASACTAITSNITATSGGSVGSASFAAIDLSVTTQRAALTQGNQTITEQIAAAASWRYQARGFYQLSVAANAFSSAAGSVIFSATPATSTIVAALPAVATGSIIDTASTISLGPECQQFNDAATFCIYVGDTPAGYTRSMLLTSQKDCGDASKGYTAYEPMTEAVFDPVSGKLCGRTTHFSIVVPVLVPITTAPTVSKAIPMGGACPGDCSGHGFCRAEGKCLCFGGYTGIDCADRACPADESWDSADGIVHKPAECSNRGACDRGTGQCKCYPGFEGRACQRTACPAGCAGRGRCMLLKDLPLVQQVGYTSWESARTQLCRCDGGYTGLDCSQRQCPFGDDPETVCQDAGREVQTVTLDFGSIPSGINPALYGLYDTDEFALGFTHSDGTNLTTVRINDVFDSAAGRASFTTALKSLPGFAVSDVEVSATIAADNSRAAYAITFDGTSLAFTIGAGAGSRSTSTGNTVAGPQALLQCPTDSYGAMGCTAPGCRPLFKQLRLLDKPAAGLTISNTAVLKQPAQLSPSDSTTSQWGVVVTIVVTTRAETGTQTYAATSQVYGKATGSTSNAATVAETPLPPAGLRTAVPLVYGLEVDFASTVADGTYVFRWRLPSCSVARTRAADPDLESLECSGRGACDRKVGECRCFAGYGGSSCGMQSVVV